MATPDYVLTEDYNHYVGPHDTRILKAGSFVRPIEFEYLPKHITDNKDNAWAAKYSSKSFCYTFYGIILIPTELLRRK